MAAAARRGAERVLYLRHAVWQIIGIMAKRMMTRFDRGAFPTYETVDENGYPQPCTMGHPWVNPDTLKTIRKRGGRRTDAFGRPIESASRRG